MSLTILEVLENAQYNLNQPNSTPEQILMGKEQLKNALYLIVNYDKGLHDKFDKTLLEDDENNID